MSPKKTKSVSEYGISKSHWPLWCRLCGRRDQHSVYKVFFKKNRSEGRTKDTSCEECDKKLLAAIEFFFSVKISHKDYYPKIICTTCFIFLTTLMNFTEKVALVQNYYVLLRAQIRHLKKKRKQKTLNEKRQIKWCGSHLLGECNVVKICRPSEVPKLKHRKKKRSKRKKRIINFYSDSSVDVSEEPNETDNTETDVNVTSDFDSIPSKDEVWFDDVALCNPFEDLKIKHEDQKQSKIVQHIKAYSEFIMGTTPPPSEDEDQNQSKIEELIQAHSEFNIVVTHPPSVDAKLKHEDQNQSKIEELIQAHSELNTVVTNPPSVDAKVKHEDRNQSKMEEHIKAHSDLNIGATHPPTVEAKVKRNDQNQPKNRGRLLIKKYTPLFKCDECPRSFHIHRSLRIHMKEHEPEMFVCQQCGLQHSSPDELNEHLLLHVDRFDHECDICGRAYKTVKELNKHLIVHTGLKPYVCEFCRRTFANGTNCRSHKLQVHNTELAALEAAAGTGRGQSISRRR